MTEKSKIICTDTASGSITLKEDNELKIQFNLSLKFPLPETDVLKIYLSTGLKDLPPINAGTAHMNGRDFTLSKTIHLPEDYKNAVSRVEILRKNVFTENAESIITVDFNEEIKKDSDFPEPPPITNLPDISEIQEKLTFLTENPAYNAYLSSMNDLKSPVQNAADILENLKESLSIHSKDAHTKCFEYINEQAKKYKQLSFTKGFDWFIIEDAEEDFGLSSIQHILLSQGAKISFGNYGHFLLGIKNSENIICIAIPTEKETPCPIREVDDCSFLISPENVPWDYYATEIALEPDGQYFIKL